MKKLLVSGFTALLCVAAAMAETDYVAMPIIRDIQKGVDNKNQIQDLRVLDSVTVGGAMTVAGNATLSGSVDVDSVTVDAGAGITVQSAGALKIGAATATSIDYGSSAVTAHTFTSDGTGTAEVVLPAGAIDSTEVLNDTLVNADINSAAAIAHSKLALSNEVTSLDIKEGEIVNADVNASAAIVGSKLNLTSGTGDITMASPKVFSNGGTVKMSGYVVHTPSYVSGITNGQELAVNDRCFTRLTAAVADSTNTLANPVVGYEGQVLEFVNVSGAGTNITFLKAANLALGGASRTIGPHDVLMLRAENAVNWVEVGFVDNTLGP